MNPFYVDILLGTFLRILLWIVTSLKIINGNHITSIENQLMRINRRELTKIQYYREQLGIECIPLVVGGGGRFGPRFLRFIRAMTKDSILSDPRHSLNIQHLPYTKQDIYTIRYLGFQFMKLLIAKHVRLCLLDTFRIGTATAYTTDALRTFRIS